MFEIGKEYRITTGVGDSEGYSTYTVLDWQPPLLKVDGPEGEQIFNTNALTFSDARMEGQPTSNFGVTIQFSEED